jgi:hypothetical protein
MKDPNFIVRIPEPCHEDWNKMKPEEKGRFCNSCSKTVVDFSNKTDVEIRKILDESPKGQVCGHFKKSQLDRPLNYKIDFNNLPKNISTTKAFTIALFLVFGSILFSCTDEKNKKLNVVGIIPPPTEETTTMGAPRSYELINKINEIEESNTVDGAISIIPEYHVNGGVGYDVVDPAKDSVFSATKDTSHIYETMGLMIMEVQDPDTTNSDSVTSKNSVVLIGENVITKNTDLSVYPNPSNGEFTIKYDVQKCADIKIDIYDLKGDLIKTIVNQPSQYEGKYQIPVNLNEMPAGIYFVNLIKGEKKFTEKVVIGK